MRKLLKSIRCKPRYALHPTGTLLCTCKHAELDHDAFGCMVSWCACCAMTPVELWMADE